MQGLEDEELQAMDLEPIIGTPHIFDLDLSWGWMNHSRISHPIIALRHPRNTESATYPPISTNPLIHLTTPSPHSSHLTSPEPNEKIGLT